MRELDTCVTTGTQTHASDGMATLLVTTPEKARELSPRPEIDISFVGQGRGADPSGADAGGAGAGRAEAARPQTGLDHGRHGRGQEPQPVRRQRRHLRQGARVRLEQDEHDRLLAGVGTSPGADPHPDADRGAGGSGGARAAACVLLFGCAAGDVGIAAVFAGRRKGGSHDKDRCEHSTLQTLGLGSVLDIFAARRAAGRGRRAGGPGVRPGRRPRLAGDLRRQRDRRRRQDDAARLPPASRSACRSIGLDLPGRAGRDRPPVPGAGRGRSARSGPTGSWGTSSG